MKNTDVVKATGIGYMLWNPTNEDFPMQYAGRSFTLHSGERIEVNEKCANHVLNAFGQRGLTFLKYGDDEKTVGEEAIARNMDFKRAQVSRYNEMNEQRKLSRLGSLAATPILKKYALELGVELLAPYTLRDEEKEAIAKSTVENEILKQRLAKQDEEMAEMRTMMKQLMSGNKTEEAAEGETKGQGSELRIRRDGKWVKQ